MAPVEESYRCAQGNNGQAKPGQPGNCCWDSRKEKNRTNVAIIPALPAGRSYFKRNGKRNYYPPGFVQFERKPCKNGNLACGPLVVLTSYKNS